MFCSISTLMRCSLKILKSINNYSSAYSSVKMPICSSGLLAEKSQKTKSLPLLCATFSIAWGRREVLKPSAYALGLAMVAAVATLVSLWVCGLPVAIKLPASLVIVGYWWYWWRQQQVNWCVLYPDKIVLGVRGRPVVCSTQHMSYWGACFVVGKHCLWRDQVTPQQWRYLQVLKRW